MEQHHTGNIPDMNALAEHIDVEQELQQIWIICLKILKSPAGFWGAGVGNIAVNFGIDNREPGGS